MVLGDEGQRRVAVVVLVELIISLIIQAANVLPTNQAIAVFLFLAAITIVLYLRPGIFRRIRGAALVLWGRQPDQFLSKLGIQSGVASSRGSKFSPKSCMTRTEHDLDFMGILGSKWVEKPGNFNRLRSLLTEIEQDGNEIRFLLADWTSDGYQRHLERRNRESLSLVRRADHYLDYLQLDEEFECLEVRLYSQIPTFRLVFIDDKELGVSRYRYEPPNEDFDRGRKIPHMIIEKDARYSFYAPFQWTFEEIWMDSEPISQDHLPTTEDDL